MAFRDCLRDYSASIAALQWWVGLDIDNIVYYIIYGLDNVNSYVARPSGDCTVRKKHMLVRRAGREPFSRQHEFTRMNELPLAICLHICNQAARGCTRVSTFPMPAPTNRPPPPPSVKAPPQRRARQTIIN